MRFHIRLAERIKKTGGNLCVGLDPRPELMPEHRGEEMRFLRKVVEETADFAAAFKPNMAYFEAMGLRGIEMLEELLGEIPDEVPVILDAKRSDIGETQRYYARSYFENWKVDAVTLNPFLGYDSLKPFLDWEGKGVYLLAITSNAGSADFQQQELASGRFVYELVGDLALRAIDEGLRSDVGLVMGLTNAGSGVLERLPDVPLLIPGLGAQGGDLKVLRHSGRQAPGVVNVSRGILYAQPERSFREKARSYRDQLADIF